MRRGAIIGVGNTHFRARWIEKTYLELQRDAASAVPADAADLQALLSRTN